MRLEVPGGKHALFARPDTSDYAAFKEVFGGGYDISLPTQPRLIFDLGANAGYAAVAFALRFPGARVVAVEPDPSNAALARRNAQSLAIDVIEAAIWPNPAQLSLDDPGKGHWGLRVGQDPSGPRPVAGVTMSQLLERADSSFVDLVKIDIEGSELELFSENTGWLDAVGVVVVELHDRFRPGCREAMQAALRRSHAQFREDRRGATTVLTRLSSRGTP